MQIVETGRRCLCLCRDLQLRGKAVPYLVRLWTVDTRLVDPCRYLALRQGSIIQRHTPNPAPYLGLIDPRATLHIILWFSNLTFDRCCMFISTTHTRSAKFCPWEKRDGKDTEKRLRANENLEFHPRIRDVVSAVFNYRLQLPHRFIPSLDADAPRCQGSLASVSRFLKSQGPFLAFAPRLASCLSFPV